LKFFERNLKRKASAAKCGVGEKVLIDQLNDRNIVSL